VVRAPASKPVRVAIAGRLYIGRTCAGIDEPRRLLLAGEGISRDHCHIVLDPHIPRAVVVDTSTNGVRVNGVSIERSVPVTICHGDRLTVGRYQLDFDAAAYLTAPPQGGAARSTDRLIAETRMCVVCGDLVDYTGLTGLFGGQALFGAMHAIFDELRVVLRAHQGTLYDYVGDALLAVWEHGVFPDAVHRAVGFARAADRCVTAMAPQLELRRPDGSPLCMGWAVTVGVVASSSYTGTLQGLVGDAVNIGFRLAGLAGRDGRPAILVTADAFGELDGDVRAEPPLALVVRGRDSPVVVHPLL
jgi:class 3 adenylate cyclase